MKASIIYNSKHGTTKAYAEEIARFLKDNGIDTKLGSIGDYDRDYLKSADLVFLGCWTSGLFLFAQHPERLWSNFAKELPGIKDKKICLFTTYKLATGSMFRKMEMHLKENAEGTSLYLKAKSGALTKDNREDLKLFVGKKE